MHTAERSTHDPSKMVELPEILLHAACDDLLLSVIQLLPASWRTFALLPFKRSQPCFYCCSPMGYRSTLK